VDAICINQTDTLERNHQVSQMQEIYSDAKEVIVWLGPSTSTSSMAIYFIEELYEVFEDLEVNKGYDNDFETMDPKICGALLPSVSLGEKIVKKLEAFNELISRPWWNRVVRLIASCPSFLIRFACLQVTCFLLIPRETKSNQLSFISIPSLSGMKKSDSRDPLVDYPGASECSTR
jgi:hypothetical protein